MKSRVVAVLSAAVLVLSMSPAQAAQSELEGGDQRATMLAPEHELLVGPAAPQVEHGVTSLPPPEPGAEAYPMPASRVLDVVGGGFGHGIGMSQYGAHGAGLQGLTHSQILAFYYPGTDLETWDVGQVRVGITIDDDGVTQVSRRPGLAASNAPGGTSYPLSTAYDQFRVRTTTASPSGCVLEGRSGGGSWAAAWPSGLTQACPVTFSTSEQSVDVVLPGGQVRVYRGQITATHRGTTSLLTVNHLPMQSYLRSVTLAEMPSSFHQQALRAQSVAARTYALSGSSATGHYDVCDTTWCQAYRGMGVRTSSGGLTSYEHPNTDSAVSATDGQVLTYVFGDGIRRLATAMYSSSTGGHTTNAPGAGHGYLIPQPDPYDAVSINPRASWNAELTASSLQSRYQIHRVERVQILTRDGHGQWGGRILDARVEGFTAGGTYTWAYATGDGLAAARPWPTWTTGLSSNYFTFTGGSAPQPPAPVRISGTNRYGTAAQVSQAWSPGVSVVYIASGQQFADALAAASRAGVYDAPVLLTRSGSLPTQTRSALDRLSPVRLVVIGGQGAVSEQVLDQLRPYASSGIVERVSGGDRYQTAAALAAYYPVGGSRVYLASGEDFPDALAGAALSGSEQAPMLLTRRNQLDASTITQLQRLDVSEVVVLGGTAAVSNAVAQQAASYTRTGTHRRLSGPDRYATMASVAEQFTVPTGSTAHVASGQNFPDALVGAALAGWREVPLVLTQGDGIPAGTHDALTRQDPDQMVVIGGTGVITPATVELLRQYL